MWDARDALTRDARAVHGPLHEEEARNHPETSPLSERGLSLTPSRLQSPPDPLT